MALVFIKEINYLEARAAHWNSWNYLCMVEIQCEKVLLPLSTQLCCKVRVETTCQEVRMRIYKYCWYPGWFLTQVSKQSWDETILHLLLIFTLFPPRFGQVWLQCVYRLWRVFMNVRKIAVSMAKFVKNQEKQSRIFPVLILPLWIVTLNPSLYISQAWFRWCVSLGGLQGWCQQSLQEPGGVRQVLC